MVAEYPEKPSVKAAKPLGILGSKRRKVFFLALAERRMADGKETWLGEMQLHLLE